jgi:hypothetical protein
MPVVGRFPWTRKEIGDVCSCLRRIGSRLLRGEIVACHSGLKKEKQHLVDSGAKVGPKQLVRSRGWGASAERDLEVRDTWMGNVCKDGHNAEPEVRYTLHSFLLMCLVIPIRECQKIFYFIFWRY